ARAGVADDQEYPRLAIAADRADQVADNPRPEAAALDLDLRLELGEIRIAPVQLLVDIVEFPAHRRAEACERVVERSIERRRRPSSHGAATRSDDLGRRPRAGAARRVAGARARLLNRSVRAGLVPTLPKLLEAVDPRPLTGPFLSQPIEERGIDQA